VSKLLPSLDTNNFILAACILLKYLYFSTQYSFLCKGVGNAVCLWIFKAVCCHFNVLFMLYEWKFLPTS
jgi:hypothetical protein